jgi:integrase
MARKVKDRALDSREARGKLSARGKPYWRAIERGLHLGYRRLKGRAGTWWARHYVGNQAYEVESVGAADDLSDADGVAILDYWQAQARARELMVRRAHAAAGKTGPFTVAQAMEDYFQHLATEGKDQAGARNWYEAHIRSTLGDVKISELRTKQIRAWHLALAKRPARLRTKNGDKQRYRPAAMDDETIRRRQSTANRALVVLRAALNLAFREGKAASDVEWRKVRPFKKVDSARVRYLQLAEAQRLINAADPDFRKLVEAALQTGARYGELCRLRVADFNNDVGTLTVRMSKSGKSRHIVLTDEGAAFFRQLCMGRAGHELILAHENGAPWGKSHQGVPMKVACARAKITPPINFHGLRHTWASLSVMAGVPLLVTAQNLGHLDTRMVERHYGHLAPGYIRDAIKAGAPKFKAQPTNIRALR